MRLHFLDVQSHYSAYHRKELQDLCEQQKNTYALVQSLQQIVTTGFMDLDEGRQLKRDFEEWAKRCLARRVYADGTGQKETPRK